MIKNRILLSFAFLLGCAPFLLAGGGGVAGAETCGGCHEDQLRFFQATPHADAFFLGEKGGGCEACHGPGERHVESNEAADIRGPKVLNRWSTERQSEACLSCHRKNLKHWTASLHDGAVSCWDCHREMLHFVKEGKRASCATCHRDMAMLMKQQYAHRQSCVSCHDPHDPIPSDSETSDLCLQCHQEYRGPFLYEHGALDEGCTVCHNPHATATRRLLRMTGNGLCLQCHAQSDFPAIGKEVHSPMLEGGALCYDCHIQIHGSNTDPNFNPRLR